MSEVNPDEAPEGYRAEPQYVKGHCIGCDLIVYLQDGYFTCPEWANCIGEGREDGQDVIFKKVEG